MDAKFHARFRHRLCQDGSSSDFDSPSLPLTEAAVDYFHDCMPSPEGLGRLDLSTASKICGQNGVSPCSMVTSALYAKRLRHGNTKYLQSMSSSDIFFISMMMASKYLYDEGVEEEVFNDEWADETGQEVQEVNKMETDFLDAMDWRLFVRPEEFEDVLAALERRLALKEGLKRGWFTYTELTILLDSGLLYNLWNQVGLDCSKLATVLSTAYLASVMSMIGSATVASQLSGPLTTATLAVLTIQPSFLFGTWPPALTAPRSNLQNELPAPLFSDMDTNMSLNNGFESMTPDLQVLELGISMKENESSTDTEIIFQAPESSAKDDASSVNYDQSSKSVEDETGPPPTKLARSSVLSLWLFDSLLSHIWSVLKPKPHQQRGSFDNCQESLDSSIKDPRESLKNRKSFRSCQCHCSNQSASKSCEKKSAKSLRKPPGPNGWKINKACKLETRKNFVTAAYIYENDSCRDDDGISRLDPTPCHLADRCDSLTCDVYESCVWNSKKPIFSSPLLNTPSHLIREDSSSKEKRNVALLNVVNHQNCKLSSQSALDFSGTNAIFSGLPGSIMVT